MRGQKFGNSLRRSPTQWRHRQDNTIAQQQGKGQKLGLLTPKAKVMHPVRNNLKALSKDFQTRTVMRHWPTNVENNCGHLYPPQTQIEVQWMPKLTNKLQGNDQICLVRCYCQRTWFSKLISLGRKMFSIERLAFPGFLWLTKVFQSCTQTWSYDLFRNWCSFSSWAKLFANQLNIIIIIHLSKIWNRCCCCSVLRKESLRKSKMWVKSFTRTGNRKTCDFSCYGVWGFQSTGEISTLETALLLLNVTCVMLGGGGWHSQRYRGSRS